MTLLDQVFKICGR